MKKIVLIVLLALGSVAVFGQTALHRKAEKSFSQFEFASAAVTYQKILKKNPHDHQAKIRLEQCYKFLTFRAWKNGKNNRPATPNVMPIETK